jgi:hypothetical protein
MRKGSNRHFALLVLLGAVLVLAGCTSGPSTNSTTSAGTATATANATPTDAAMTTTAGGGSGGEGGDSQPTGYQWSENESYTYDDRGGNTYVFTVESIEDGQVTVNFTAVRGGQASSRNITGEQGRFFRSLSEEDRSKFGFWAFTYDGRLAAVGQDLEVGNTWTGQSDGSSYSAEVTGTSTVLGQECYDLRIESSSGTLEPCVRKDWPLSLAVTGSGSQGLTIQFNATDYDRP